MTDRVRAPAVARAAIRLGRAGRFGKHKPGTRPCVGATCTPILAGDGPDTSSPVATEAESQDRCLLIAGWHSIAMQSGVPSCLFSSNPTRMPFRLRHPMTAKRPRMSTGGPRTEFRARRLMLKVATAGGAGLFAARAIAAEPVAMYSGQPVSGAPQPPFSPEDHASTAELIVQTLLAWDVDHVVGMKRKSVRP